MLRIGKTVWDAAAPRLLFENITPCLPSLKGETNVREKESLNRRTFMVLGSAAIASPWILNMIGHLPEANAEETKKTRKGKIYFINRGCIGCQVCMTFCPQQAIRFGNCGNEIEQDKCIHCGTCHDECPISIISETEI